MKQLVEEVLAEETEILGDSCPTATLPTTNPTGPVVEPNPGRRRGNPATNCPR
jgi:hypothetical protein